jgi:hypothetical protein
VISRDAVAVVRGREIEVPTLSDGAVQVFVRVNCHGLQSYMVRNRGIVGRFFKTFQQYSAHSLDASPAIWLRYTAVLCQMCFSPEFTRPSRKISRFFSIR